MIETSRLLLRPFCVEDAEDLYEYLKEPAVHCFACMKLADVEAAKVAAQERANDAKYTFAIVLKETGKVIGEIEAHPESSQPDLENCIVKDTFSPCWMLNKDYQGKGYAYEAAHAFFDYLFEKLDARRIYAYTEDDNLPSQHLCEKLGMRVEGLFQEFVTFVNDEYGKPIYENTMQYAILKKEWEAQKKPMKKVKITAIRKTCYPDLMALYENPIAHACNIEEGMSWVSENGEKPNNFCDSAWESMASFVKALAQGGGNFYDGWMKDPQSAMISCNDGFRPVSFYLELLEKENTIC